MPTVHETAYPRLKSSVIRRELIDLYTPTHVRDLLGRQRWLALERPPVALNRCRPLHLYLQIDRRVMSPSV